MKAYQYLILGLIFCSINASAQKNITYRHGDFLIEASDTMRIDFIIKGKSFRKRTSKGDTLYEDKKYLILGDNNKISSGAIYKRYKLKYKFSSFSASIYHGKLATPNFRTDKSAYMFRTQIRDQCKRKGINFAGHYTIAEWGCGSPCQQIAIVDRLNGTIYYSTIPQVNGELGFGLTYRSNSRIMIINSDLLTDHKGYIFCNSVGKVQTIDWRDNKAGRLPE